MKKIVALSSVILLFTAPITFADERPDGNINSLSRESTSSAKGMTALDILNQDAITGQYDNTLPSEPSQSSDTMTIQDILNGDIAAPDSQDLELFGLNYEAEFTVEPLMYSETMTPEQIPKDIPSRCQWYKEKMGRFFSDINAIGFKEGVPPKLLATIVLNEMADVDMTDVVQDTNMWGTKGDYDDYHTNVQKVSLWWKNIAHQSYGVAQISPRTALEYNAVHIPPSLKRSMTRENEVELYVGYRLLDRRLSIKAAAKIIKGILGKIEKQQDQSAWVKQFVRPGARFSSQNPYAALNPPPGNASSATPAFLMARDKNLAQLVTAIYNSADILIARNVPDPGTDRPGSYPNAHKHSINAIDIAIDLSSVKPCGIGLKRLPPHNREKKCYSSANGIGKDCCKGHSFKCKFRGQWHQYHGSSIDENLDWVCDLCGQPFMVKPKNYVRPDGAAMRGDYDCKLP